MKYISSVILILFMSMNAFSQEIFTGISYNMGTTFLDTRDFVADYSWRGIGFEFRNYRGNNLSIGFSASWNIFDQKTNEIIELEQVTVSGTQIRYFNAFPLMLNAHYYIGNNYDQVRPYVGLNVGPYYITQRLEIGIFTFEKNNLHFGLAPEFGMFFSTYGNSVLFVNARYYYAFKAGKSIGGGQGWDFQYWGFNAGVAFSYNPQ